MSAYVQSLTVLQRIREVAGSELKLPQMCVVGDQSSGKSSVLERLTNIDFPVKDGICTRVAIVVECRRDPALVADKYEVKVGTARDDGRASDAGAWSEESAAEGARTALSSGPSPSGSGSARSTAPSAASAASGYEECSAAELAARITNLQNQALVDCGHRISDKEILVRVAGPQQVDIIVIDLPGIINQGDGVDETRALIEKYISQEESLILLVSEAKQDDELVTAMGMARKHDPLGVRTKRILTKFDSFDTDAAKQRAVALVNAGRGEGADAQLLGAHALICRPNGNKKFDPAGERAGLESLGLACDCCGVDSLKDTLPGIYATLIRTNLPKLRASIEAHRWAAEAELRKVGAEPVGGPLMIKACQEALLARETAVDEALSKHILDFQQAIHKTEDKLEREWVHAKLQPNVFVCAIFNGSEALRACMAVVAGWWRPLMNDLVTETHKILLGDVEMTLLGPLSCGVPQHLRDTMLRQWRVRCAEVVEAFAARCAEVLEREIDFGTVNHYLTSKFAAERALPDDVVEAFVTSIGYADVCNFNPTTNALEKVWELDVLHSNLRKKLLDQLAVHEKAFKSKSLHEQQQERLFDAVEALWAVEHKTFIDMIVKEVRSGPRRALYEWARCELLTCTEIRESAVEDAGTAKARQHQKDVLCRMQQCLRELESLRGP